MIVRHREIMAESVTLEDLFLFQVRDMYDAEQRQTQAFPRLAETAGSPELQRALSSHLAETDNHLARLDRIFGILEENPAGKTCEAIRFFLEDFDAVTDDDVDSAIADERLAAAARKVEHYEIAGYGTLRTWADLLGRKEAAQLLDFTLEEERLADGTLDEIARRMNIRTAVIRRR